MATNERLAGAGRVGRIVDLVEIRLIHLQFDLLSAWDPPYDVNAEWTMKWQRGETPSELVAYTFGLSLTSRKAEDPDENILASEIEFLAVYRIPSDENVTDDDLQSFGEISARPMVFPYFRELVQSLTTRAALPPLTLDPIRVPIDIPDD